MAISNLYFEIGGDTTRLNKALDQAVENAKQAGIKISGAGKSMLKAFDDALNPTKRLGDQIKVLTAAGKSSADIWKVYGGRLQEAAARTKAMGQAVDPAVRDLIRLNATAVKTQSIFGKIGQAFSTVRGALLGIGVGIGLHQITRNLIEFGEASTKAAMDAIESENLFAVSMGGMANEAVKWSKQLSESLGLNQYELRKSIGTFNVMFDAMGIGTKKAYEMAAGLTELAYDFASFYNLRPDEAFTKLRAGITGETEPLKRLGILVDEATTKAYAYKTGIAAIGGELTQQQKVLARYGAIMEQTTAAQGDLARTLTSPANALRVLQSRFDEIKITLGMAFLPAVVSTIEVISEFLKSISTGAEGLRGLANELAYPIRRFNELSIQAALANRVFLELKLSTQKFFGASEEKQNKTKERLADVDEIINKILGRMVHLEDALDAVGKFDYNADKAKAALKALQDEISSPQATAGTGKYTREYKNLIDAIGLGSRKVKEFNAEIKEFGDLDYVPYKHSDAWKEFEGYLDSIGVKVPDVSKKISETSGKIAGMGDLMRDAMKGWADDWSRNLNDMLWDADTTFGDILKSFAKMLTQMLIQYYIVQPLFKGITRILGGGEPAGMAKGGVFSGPVGWDGAALMPFARGGVVTKPKIFPMASGAGLMGEAGPEAIMPLTRVGGDLGVKATPAVINVNISTPAGTKAEVSESESGRGERNINVIISEVVAGEMQRYGSPANRSLRLMGAKSPIIRR